MDIMLVRRMMASARASSAVPAIAEWLVEYSFSHSTPTDVATKIMLIPTACRMSKGMSTCRSESHSSSDVKITAAMNDPTAVIGYAFDLLRNVFYVARNRQWSNRQVLSYA